MTYLLKLLVWVERWTEKVVGAVLRGSMAVLARVLKRGRHRSWRRPQGA